MQLGANLQYLRKLHGGMSQESALAQANRPLRMIGWDFPFVSKEQQNRLGLRGYAAGWILPEGF